MLEQNGIIPPLNLADFGLKSPIYEHEAEVAVAALRNKIGIESFDTIAKRVRADIKNMTPGQKFYFRDHYKDIDLEVFMVTVFRLFFIGDYYEFYSFSENYDYLKRCSDPQSIREFYAELSAKTERIKPQYQEQLTEAAL